MNFADEWSSVFPECCVETSAPEKRVNTADFEDEYESFVKEQKKLRAERLAKETAEMVAKETENFVGYTEPIRETVPSEQVTEIAYQAFIQEDEKPKSKKKKKTEAVVEETPEVTEEVAEN